MNKIGIILIFIFSFSETQSSPLFKYTYLRLASGGCVKCLAATKVFNYVKDEYKPIIVFGSNEMPTYKSDLVANALENWPQNKMIFSDSLHNLLPISEYGALYATNDNINFEKIILDYVFNPAWLNIFYLNTQTAESNLDSNLVLGKICNFISDTNTFVLHNAQIKTIYLFTHNRFNKIKLSEKLKLEILNPYIEDSIVRNKYIESFKSLAENNLDMSEFMSFQLKSDTLITLVSIAYLKFGKKANVLMRNQFLCIFVNNKLIKSTKIHETKQRILYAGWGGNNICFRNDSLFMRCDMFNSKEEMMQKNHLALLTIKNNEYHQSKLYNLEVPKNLLDSSQGFMDYTTGGFYYNSTGSVPNYFFNHSITAFENGINKYRDNFSLTLNGDTGVIVDAKKQIGLTAMLVYFKRTKDYYLYYMDDSTIVKQKIFSDVASKAQSVAFSYNGISYLDVYSRKIVNIKITPSSLFQRINGRG